MSKARKKSWWDLGGEKSDILQNSNEVTIEVYIAAFRNKRHHTALEKKAVVCKLKKRHAVVFADSKFKNRNWKHIISLCIDNITWWEDTNYTDINCLN